MKQRSLMEIRKKPVITAFAMILLGIGTGIGSQSYQSAYDLPFRYPQTGKTVEALADPQESLPGETTILQTTEEETEEEVIYTPSVSSLNLAYYYPENVDVSNPVNSYAGEILETLSLKDSEWLSSIYELSSTSPEAMAAKLGKAGSSVMGLYNPKDEKQDPQKPETWKIHDWSKINMTFYDEEGNVISASSNIKEIMAMANVYFYYKNPQDSQEFLNYVLALWEKSHSFQYSMSDVYYCDGCVEESGEGTETSSEAVTSTAAETLAGPGVNLASASDAQTAAESMGETVPDTAAASTEESTSLAGAPYSVLESMGIPETTGGETAVSNSELPSDGSSADDEKKEAYVKCPGHIDLRIHASIAGLSASKKGLFALDTVGSQADGAWTGWTEENRKAAKVLYDQDWEKLYGLTIFSSYIANPLTSAEVAYYMDLLPADTSQARRKVIQYALSSVGKIPYYWGGKPAAPDYVQNHFGALITPDEKGRSMKGLDCSGWVNWVYWSSIGVHLPAEGTEGLAFCGTGISRNDLKAGDIIVRRGKDAHVVIFLCWESDGRMKVIHESSSGNNNVSVGTMEARWPYYRKLID